MMQRHFFMDVASCHPLQVIVDILADSARHPSVSVRLSAIEMCFQLCGPGMHPVYECSLCVTEANSSASVP